LRKVVCWFESDNPSRYCDESVGDAGNKSTSGILSREYDDDTTINASSTALLRQKSTVLPYQMHLPISRVLSTIQTHNTTETEPWAHRHVLQPRYLLPGYLFTKMNCMGELWGIRLHTA
jgi:hypothetical protein